RTQPIIGNSTTAMLKEHILPVAEKLREEAIRVGKEEDHFLHLKRTGQEEPESEADLQNNYQILVRDLYAFIPLLIKYVDLHRSSWLKNPCLEAEHLFQNIADIFNLWSK
ncbi:unnamed protein product, partial [Owenia fusiformis]